MTLAKRIDDIEGRNLTPHEAVILWMREAHQFDLAHRLRPLVGGSIR